MSKERRLKKIISDEFEEMTDKELAKAINEKLDLNYDSRKIRNYRRERDLWRQGEKEQFQRDRRLLVLGGIGAVMGFGFHYFRTPEPHTPVEIKSAPVEKPKKSPQELVDLINKHAVATPARELNPNKPVFFYIGQDHQIMGVKNGKVTYKYKAEGLASQETIYRVLVELINEDGLSSIFYEGSSGKHPGLAESFHSTIPHVDKLTKQILEENPLVNGLDLALLMTGFESVFGVDSKKTSERLTINEIIVTAKKKEFDEILSKASTQVTLSRYQVAEYLNAYTRWMNTIRQDTEASINNPLSMSKDTNGSIAVIMGYGHIEDLIKLDSEDKLGQLHERYNLVYVLTGKHKTLDELKFMEGYRKAHAQIRKAKDKIEKDNARNVIITVK